MRLFRLETCLCILLSTFVPVLSVFAQESQQLDLILKEATIIDGTGKPGFKGDIAIQNNRIVSVGPKITQPAKQIIQCQGLTVAPGFIDLHNHSDFQIISPLTRANMNYVTQGCTTIVTGNCGSGPVYTEQYYRKIDTSGSGTNVIHLIPQGSLRDKVMGSGQRDPTSEELEKMKALALKAMQEEPGECQRD